MVLAIILQIPWSSISLYPRELVEDLQTRPCLRRCGIRHSREPCPEELLEVVYKAPFVYHQTHPSTVLALTMHLYDRAPRAILLSLLGHDFDFGAGLSDETAALVEPAVDRILELAASALNGTVASQELDHA